MTIAIGERVRFQDHLVGAESSRRYDVTDTPFEGFTPKGEVWARSAIERIGLPTNNVTSVTYRPNERGRENVLGQAHWDTGELRAYKSISDHPEIAQISVLAHELAHHATPWHDKNQSLYGESQFISAQEMRHAREHSLAIAEQSRLTGIFLNGYHKELFRRLDAGELSPARFIEETQAIMVSERFGNPNHLRQVQESQRKEIERLQMNNKTEWEYVSITATEEELKYEWVGPVGIDRSLIALMNGVSISKQLNNHIEDLRASFSREKSPLMKD